MTEYLKMDLKGMDELNFNLTKIGSNAQLYGAEVLVKTMVRPIIRSARQKVPVKTGNLLKSIKAVKKHDKARGWFRYLIGNTVGKRAKNDGWYGRLVEFGTAPHSIKRGRTLKRDLRFMGGPNTQSEKIHPGAEAKPWLRPAFDENWKKALDAGVRKYKKIIENTKGLKQKAARYR